MKLESIRPTAGAHTQVDTMGTPGGSGPVVGRAKRWRRQGGGMILLCILAVAIVYVHSASSYGKSLTPYSSTERFNFNFENRVASSLLAHQLSLNVKTPRGLLQLRDPYDPRANARYRGKSKIHDLSLYKGKLYSYFGPAPAILLYIPFRALGIGQLSPTLATLIFFAVGFLFSIALFRLLVRWCWRRIPIWIHCIAVVALGLGVPSAWAIYIGRDYEATIGCAYMLLFAGVYFLARGTLVGSSRTYLALGSGALGLAVATRPTMIVAGAFVLVAAVFVSRAGFDNRRRNTSLAALLAPYLTIAVLIALYNYARFDSITEFGQSYQLAGFNARTYRYGSITFLPKGIFYYLFSPGRLTSAFPYLFLRKSTLDLPRLLQNRGYHNEPVAGIFTNMPAAAAGYVLLLTRLRSVARRFPRALVMLVVLLIPAVSVLVLISYQYRGTTMRYELDFAPLIVMGSLLAWVAWNRSVSRPSRLVGIGNGLFLAAVTATIAFNLAITLTPCKGTGSC